MIDTRWRVANLVWIVAGFLFYWLSPATAILASGLQPFLSSSFGFSDELLASRVAFTLVRVPLTALFGVLVAVVQCAVVPGVALLARRWLIASAVGAAVSTLVLLPSSLILFGNSSVETTRTFLALAGATLFGGFVSFSQWRATRGRLRTSGWFVVAGASGAAAGAFARLLVTSASRVFGNVS